jgi:ABC-2 type transport system permease protein
MINRNLYLKELKRSRLSLLSWSLSISLLLFLGMAVYPVLMQDDVLKQLTAFFESPFMKNIAAAFGASLDVLTNVLGFYAARNAVFILLLGSFFSVLLAGRILAQEERDKTAEFLLTRPVTRIEIVGSKVAAFLTCLLGLDAFLLIVGYVSLESFKGDSEYRLSAYLVHSLYAFLLMLTFGALSLFLSLLIKRGRPATGLSIGMVVGGYFFDVISKVTPSADKIGYISPFKFMDASVLSPDYGLSWWRVLYFLGVSLLFVVSTFLVFRKKDILV